MELGIQCPKCSLIAIELGLCFGVGRLKVGEFAREADAFGFNGNAAPALEKTRELFDGAA